MNRFSAILLAGAMAFGTAQLVSIGPAHAEGDAEKGAKLARQRCRTCHELEKEEAKPTGPHLIGVVGRTAGSTDYAKYSDGLKESGIVWDEEQLDAWLTNPKDVVKKTRMNFRLRKPEQRADVIAYLKTLTN